MLNLIKVDAWQCSECGHVCRSKSMPRRCTDPKCGKVHEPKRPGPKPKSVNVSA